ALTPKKARKFKKPSSPLKKKTLVVVEEPTMQPAKKPTARDIALLEEAQLKKDIKRRKQEIDIHHAGGLSEGDYLESEVPDEPKGKSIDTGEKTSLKLGVPDVSKADSFESEYESWGDSDDDNDDDDD
ncbi:hypothetical protein Tco_1557551, partial [Tanacetum coccineum]